MDRNGLLKLMANTIMSLHFYSNAISSLTSLKGVTFIKLARLNLNYNNITHLRPEFFITPHLQILNLMGNQLVSLAEVTQYSWGSSLPKHRYLAIDLGGNPWHCNGSLIWMSSNLYMYKMRNQIIYAKPPFKPYITKVDQMRCESPNARHGTTVVPVDVIDSVKISIRSFRDLTGKCYGHLALTHLPLDKMAAILADDMFNCIFLNENDGIPNLVSPKYVPRSPINNKPAVVKVMAWRRTDDKPLPGPMMAQYIDAFMRH